LRLLESVITNTNDSVLITETELPNNGDPKIIYVNNAFTKMTGYESDEVIGKSLRILQGPKSDKKQLAKVTDALITGIHIEVEIINYKKNGEQFWNNFTIVPAVNKDGKISHFISIQRDVTARRHVEELTRIRLETLVKERTRELNDALRKEKDLVEMKNKFVTIASHEFRTPLATISFAAESIRNYFHQLTGEEITRKLIKIEDQASHMTNLLEDILTLGKSEAGKIKVKCVSLDLREFIESTIEEVRSTVKEKRQINFVFPGNKSRVNADDKLLRNIFNNLLTNALKFSGPDTPITVTVTVTDLNNEIVIEVKDEGIGIEEGELTSVFESFQRGSNASGISGTGLGLSILKKAVDLMDGSVDVKSVLNEGSIFTVHIPLR
jgi:PAS domain S-box-containing protein